MKLFDINICGEGCLSGLLVMLGIVCACEHKSLDPADLVLKVSYDWKSSVPADSMEFRLLPTDGASPALSGVFSGVNGGNCKASDGAFKALSYTHGASNVLSRNESVSAFELYTPDLVELSAIGKRTDELSAASGSGDEPVVKLPGRVCSALENTTLDIKSDSRPLLTLSPEDIMTDVEVKVLGLFHTDIIDKVAATLSGMSGSYFPVSSSASGSPSTLPVEFSIFDRTSGDLSSGFCCFGDCPGCDVNILVLYIITTGGETYKYTKNVTDQVNAGASSRHITIEVRNIDVPIDGSTFVPSVGGWKEINTQIYL